jgi:hypothetical protein
VDGVLRVAGRFDLLLSLTLPGAAARRDLLVRKSSHQRCQGLPGGEVTGIGSSRGEDERAAQSDASHQLCLNQLQHKCP